MDDTLEQLGTPKEYHRMRNSIKLIIIIWFIIICITLISNSLCYIESFNDTKAIIIPIVVNYSYFINFLIDIMIGFLLRFVYIFGKKNGTVEKYI